MQVIDSRPVNVTWLIMQGDPHDWRLHLVLLDGSPADVAGWSWAAWIGTNPPSPFECFPEDDGVTLYLRGANTYGLIGRYWPFDVACRNPLAGEGRIVLRGVIMATSRITQALSSVVTVEVAA